MKQKEVWKRNLFAFDERREQDCCWTAAAGVGNGFAAEAAAAAAAASDDDALPWCTAAVQVCVLPANATIAAVAAVTGDSAPAHICS